MIDRFWSTGRDVDGYHIGDGDDIIPDTEVIERLYKLVEYENDETNRRRDDAHKIRTLKQRVGRLKSGWQQTLMMEQGLTLLEAERKIETWDGRT